MHGRIIYVIFFSVVIELLNEIINDFPLFIMIVAENAMGCEGENCLLYSRD